MATSLGNIFSILPKEIPLVLAGVVSVNVLLAGSDAATRKQAVMDLVKDAIQGVEAAASDEYRAQIAALEPDIEKIVDGLTGIFTTRGIFGFKQVPTLVNAALK